MSAMPPRIEPCSVEAGAFRMLHSCISAEHVDRQIVNASSASGANNRSGSSSSFARPCSCE
jgi:hypothetical protein